MRKLMAIAAVVAVLVPAGARAQTVLLSVDDGNFFYDSTNDGVCNPNTNTNTGAVAARHWHVGLPFVPASAEVAGGFGCLGGPKTFGPVTVTSSATVSGSITYTWDQNVPGGCCNDVHLHVYDAGGNLVASTLDTDGYQPVNPLAPAALTHTIAITLGPGTYTFVEDIFAGEHTAWLTKLQVVE